jgi:hypothetical protein
MIFYEITYYIDRCYLTKNSSVAVMCAPQLFVHITATRNK